jgi:hypothetical protein
VTVSALKSAASYLGGLREGRKAIIFVSEGLPGIYRSNEIPLMDDLVRTANDNNTAIYTVDPKGLLGYAADELRVIADNTGAQAFVNTNSPAKALRQVVKDASAFYLLGYASIKNPMDGKFHEIKVRVKRPGLEVRARKGYWAPSATDVERAAREAAAGAPTEVAAAFAALTAVRRDRPLDLTVGTAQGANDAPEVTLTWTPRATSAPAGSGSPSNEHNDSGRSASRSRPRSPEPPASDGEARRSVEGTEAGGLVVVANGANGSHEFRAPLEARRLSFSAVPGTLRLQVIVRDSDGQTIGDETRVVEVPDPARLRIAISSPSVTLVRNASELRSLTADTTPYAGREFVRTDRLFVRFALYGEAAAGATISSRLLSRTGAALLTLAVTPPADPAGTYQIDFPLASIARGDYVIAISAEAGDDRAEALVPIRVIS